MGFFSSGASHIKTTMQMSNNMKIRLFTVPNMLTLANLLAGCAAIVFTLQYHAYETAFWLIIAAAVFDFLDGFAARLLKQTSPLGVQLDSLADDVTFGLAPAIVMYDLYIHSASYYGLDPEVMGWLKWGVLIIAAFSVLRLAKFNIDTTQSAEFEGLPTPANALMLMSLAVLAETGKVMLHQEAILLISLAASLLLISPIRMFALKFKSFGIKGNELRYGFIVAAIALIILVPAYSLLAIIVLYIALSTLRWAFVRKSQK